MVVVKCCEGLDEALFCDKGSLQRISSCFIGYLSALNCSSSKNRMMLSILDVLASCISVEKSKCGHKLEFQGGRTK